MDAGNAILTLLHSNERTEHKIDDEEYQDESQNKCPADPLIPRRSRGTQQQKQQQRNQDVATIRQRQSHNSLDTGSMLGARGL